MKLTKATLKKLIKEELGRVMEMEEEELEDGPFVVIVEDSIDDSDHYSEGSVRYLDSAGNLIEGPLSQARSEAYDMKTAMEVRDKFSLGLYDFGAGHEVAFEDSPHGDGIVDSDGNPISAADMAARF